jgi:hypothetical protein
MFSYAGAKALLVTCIEGFSAESFGGVFCMGVWQGHPPHRRLAGELRAAYEGWCATHDLEPLSLPKFAAELRALGYSKWKSCGLIESGPAAPR